MAMCYKSFADLNEMESALFKHNQERSGLARIMVDVSEEGNSNYRQESLLKVSFNSHFRTCL